PRPAPRPRRACPGAPAAPGDTSRSTPARPAARDFPLFLLAFFDSPCRCRYYAMFARRPQRSGTRAGNTMAESSAKHRAAGSFDAFRLSHEHGVLQGRLDAASLPRVADRLADGAAPIAWRISGAEDGYGRAAL